MTDTDSYHATATAILSRAAVLRKDDEEDLRRAIVEALQAEHAASLARLRAFCLNLDRNHGRYPDPEYMGLAVYSEYVKDERGYGELLEEWEEELEG